MRIRAQSFSIVQPCTQSPVQTEATKPRSRTALREEPPSKLEEFGMTYIPLTETQQSWLERADQVAADVLAPHAAETDRSAEFPRMQLDALRDGGFMGLRADKEHGGHGEGLLTTALVTEALAKACPSTGLIYKMHLESIEVISRDPTPEQAVRFVPRLASGEWLSSVAGSEAGHQGGAWAGAAKSRVQKVDGGYQVENIRKSFVTGAGQADAYMFMCSLEEEDKKPEGLTFQIQADDLEWSIDEPWDGLGMRGNQSSPMTFSGFLPESRRIGVGGAGLFGVLPVVLGTYAATYLGIGAGCYDLLHAYVADTTLADGRRMGEVETIQHRMANVKIELERSRALLHTACAGADAGGAVGPQAFFEAKVACDQAATFATQEAMTLGGGTAFAKRLPFERYFRDARAGMVMGIAHDVAVLNIAGMMFPKPKDEATSEK